MLSLLAATALAQQLVHPGQPPLEAQTWHLRITRQATMSFLVDLPEDYQKDHHKRWPVLLFLHGSGERGDDITKVRRHGPPKEIANGRKLPFIVISPQCPEGEYWDIAALGALMDLAEHRYRIDRNREYVTGLSMGGYGTWGLLAEYPGRFAAAAPICGAGNWLTARQVAKTPIWAIHGDSDPSVPIEDDRRMVEAVKRSGGDVRFDVIKGGGHDVWTDAYAGNDLYDWLLQHKRSK